jgi:RimJ/RimL family protein N-acetyltransferase
MAALTLRPAVHGDLDWLVALRNEERTARYSKRGVRAREDIEADYFHNPVKTVHVVVDGDGRDVGMGLLDDLGDGVFEIGIAIHPDDRGRGLAPHLIRATTEHAVAARGAREVHALVVPANEASICSFTRAGYVEDPARRTDALRTLVWSR